MKFLATTLTLLFQSMLVFADTTAFKCQENGKTIFSQHPCKSGTSTAIDIKTIAPSADEQLAAQKAHKQRISAIGKLEKTRERDDAKHEAISRRAANKAAAARKRCEAQQLQTKWAKEDLKNTQPKGEMKAQQKLKRAQERADFVCKDT
jgi:hypothetical protein